jgi:hypothetical protein
MVVFLPRSLNAERAQVGGFSLVKVVLDKLVNAGSSGAAAQAGPQFVEVVYRTGGHDLNIAVLGIAYPAAQIEFTGLAMNEPAESHSLHTSANKEMQNHQGQFVREHSLDARRIGMLEHCSGVQQNPLTGPALSIQLAAT